ncbi:Acid sphingomyelinase-like phosphodiesterase 3b [Blastocladiella emersonii ATCC 22665]|nr:Acid sphingomyelinase-like phosphodiesterase 3b [Blastocladiella emersonii ATCC 22665]
MKHLVRPDHCGPPGRARPLRRRAALILALLAALAMLSAVNAAVLGARPDHGDDDGVDAAKHKKKKKKKIRPPHDPGTKPSPSILRIAHITDLHLDAHYADSATADTYCHARPSAVDPRASAAAFTSQQQQQLPKNHLSVDRWKPGPGHVDPDRARYGRLGSACDTPLRLVDLATSFLGRRDLDIDLVLWTGDSGRHDRDPLLPRTEFEVYDSNERSARMLAHAMREPSSRVDSKDGAMRVFPTVGNLDIHPHNLLDPPHNTTLLGNLARALAPVVPPASPAAAALARNGTYHVAVTPLLHVVSLNTMYWSKDNAWSRGDCDVPGSPGAELIDWLDATLTEIGAAHGAQARAILLGHVPPASSTGGTSDGGNDPGPALPRALPSNYRPACTARFLELAARHAPRIASMHAGHVNEDSTMYIARVPGNATTPAGELVVLDAGDYARRAENMVDPAPLDEVQLLVPVFTAPSVIPVNNPGVRIMEFDLERAGWSRWTQYYLDLLAATNEDNEDGGGGSSLDAAKKKKKHRKKHPKDGFRPEFVVEYSTDVDYRMPSLSTVHWRATMSGANPPSSDENDNNEVGALRGDGGRQGSARRFRQKYRYFYGVKGPYPDDSTA